MNAPFHRRRIHIYVQHLLGTGHLVRMQALAAALAGAGHRVTLISGGMPAGHDTPGRPYEWFQLPPVKTAPGDFTTLLGADGRPVSADFKQRRTRQLLHQVAARPPDTLVVETFPFGRRQLRFELVALMERVAALKPRPLTLCSLRDILQLRTPERHRQTVAEVEAWFDHVLVHADPAVTTLAETFPLAGRLGDKVFHTGYLHAGSENRADRGNRGADGHDEVIVSAGGGAVGAGLLQTAIAAKRYSKLRDRRWRLLVGGNAAAEFDALGAQARRAGGGIVVERNRPDFAALLAACAVSVSQAGYNTVLDTLAANCRAVLSPFARYGETEQSHRAEKLAGLGRAVVLPEKDLDAGRLAEAVDRAAGLNVSRCRPVDLNGALRTLRFIERRGVVEQPAASAACQSGQTA